MEDKSSERTAGQGPPQGGEGSEGAPEGGHDPADEVRVFCPFCGQIIGPSAMALWKTGRTSS